MQRQRSEAVAIGAEQRSDDDVAAGAKPAVGLDDDRVTADRWPTSAWCAFGEPELPR